jgi:hypothetical protein
MTSHLDGNALAGALSEIFTADMTTAITRCATCADTSPIAAAMVFVKPNTYIVRCHVCESMLMTLQLGSHGTRIDLSGLRMLEIPRV